MKNNLTVITTAIPSWFKVAAILALIWNVLGLMAFIAQIAMTPDDISRLPQAQQDLLATTPLWATVAFAVAVISGTLASIALLMRKIICYPLYIASLTGVMVQMFHAFVISNSFEIYGPSGTIMPIMVIVVAWLLMKFSASAVKNKWFDAA